MYVGPTDMHVSSQVQPRKWGDRDLALIRGQMQRDIGMATYFTNPFGLTGCGVFLLLFFNYLVLLIRSIALTEYFCTALLKSVAPLHVIALVVILVASEVFTLLFTVSSLLCFSTLLFS